MRATREVQVHRGVETQRRIEVLAERESMALGVARREFAAGVAGAGDDAGARRARTGGQLQGGECSLDLGLSRALNIGDDDVLPHGEPQRAAAEALGDVGQAAHLRHAQASDRQRDAAIELPRGFLRVEADVRATPERGPRPACGLGKARQRRRQALLHLAEEALAAHAVEHVLEPGFFAVCPVALIDEHPHDRDGDRHALLGGNREAQVAGEIAVAGDAADRDAKAHAVGGAHRAKAEAQRFDFLPEYAARRDDRVMPSG